MSAPKLPPIQPPQIPNSMKKEGGQANPPKSNFFFILMMTFLLVWTFQVMTAKKPTPTDPLGVDSSVKKEAPTLTDDERAALPDEFLSEGTKAESVVPEFVTLGSLDEDSPYRFLITLTSRGAAITRVELSDKYYRDSVDKTGYLGQIIADESWAMREFRVGLPGVGIQAVGKGSPIEKAGLKPGDRIVGFVNTEEDVLDIKNYSDLREALLTTKPGDVIRLLVFDIDLLSENEKFQKGLERLTSYNENDDSLTASGESVNAFINELGSPRSVEVTLIEAPLSILRPSGMVCDYNDYVELAGLQGTSVENTDLLQLLDEDSDSRTTVRKLNTEPCSFLSTFSRIDGDYLESWAPVNRGEGGSANVAAIRPAALDNELGGVALRNSNWSYVKEDSSESVAVFKKVLLERQLQVVKRYELVKTVDDATEKQSEDASGASAVKNSQAYHVKLSFQVQNYNPNSSRTVSFMMDGPSGLPMEGAWYSSGRKTGPGWGSYGLRDIVVSSNNRRSFDVVKCWDIAQDKTQQSDELKLDFLGVDSQYFQCTAIPVYSDVDGLDRRFAFSPIRIGTRVPEHLNYTDVSFRLKSDDRVLAPYGQEGDTYTQEFTIFMGPKERNLMADYGLSKTIVYGWFWFVSIPLVWILHFFHDYVVFNYGLAIVLLTILVRLCLFPLSRKQVLSSIRMQKLQPELTKLKEKYQDNPQGMMVAQQALFKKYGVNPLSGCLPIFIQMPIFIGLYRALSTDVSLFGAPLFSKGIRWCSNLAAPDMAFDWSAFWNNLGWSSFNMSGRGFLSLFCLGPYLNLLPIITIALFLIQQKFLVPPVVGDDAQARQQRSMRRMMTFMMIFMGFMFFKVPSGLCIYFIISSLWGLLERKMLPKRSLELQPVSEGEDSHSSANSIRSLRDNRASGRTYTVYESRRDKKGRRIVKEAPTPPSSLKQLWREVVERAKEQQRLAKSEEEGRSFNQKKKR